MNNFAEKLEKWMPIRVAWHQTAPLIDWCYVGEERFTDSFFDQTIENLFQKPFNLLLRPLTTIDVLQECYKIRPGLKPSGFIFHLSRCGSTLVSQMLATLPKNVVISEASSLDWIIRAKVRKPDITDEEQIEWIRWMVAALGQKRSPEAEHFFIKFDSWHTFELDLLKHAFPDVPWIFLYRNPLEVMVSHSKMRGAGTVRGSIDYQIPGLSFPDSLKISQDEYIARFLAKVCEYALQNRENPNGLFVNYTQLPSILTTDILKHFNIEYTDAEIEKINSAARFDAKSPKVEFKTDVQTKQREASDEIREISNKILIPLYEELEKVRYNSKR